MNKSIIDFLNSADTELFYKDKHIRKENYENISTLYVDNSSDDITKNQIQIYLLVYDNKNQKILHININENRFLDMDEKDTFDITEYFEKLNLINHNKATEYFESKKEEYIKDIDLNNYKEYVENRYKTYDEFNEKFYVDVSYNKTKELLNQLTINKEKFEDMVYQKIIELNEEKAKNFFCKEKAYAEYIKEFDKDPLSQRKNKLYEILKNNKYKRLQILYKLPNGEIREQKLNKDEHRYSTLYNRLINKNLLHDIPIKSIEHITCRKQIIYDTNEMKKMEYSEDEQIDDFLNKGYYYGLPKKVFENKELMNAQIMKDILVMQYFSDKLLLDKDFMLDILKQTQNPNALALFKSTLYKDDDFALKCIDICIKNNIETSYIFSNCNKEILTDIDKIIEYLKNTNEYSQLNILNNISNELLNSKEINEIITPLSRFDVELVKKITNPDTLIKLYGFEMVLQNLNNVNSTLQEDDYFINYLLDNVKKINFTGDIEKLVEKNKTDMDIINKIAKSITDSYDASQILKVANITNTDNILELASKNILFLKSVDLNIAKHYLECEISGYTKIIKNEETTDIITENGKFELKHYDDGRMSLVYIDNLNNQYNIGKKIGPAIYAAFKEEVRDIRKETDIEL